MAWLAIENGKEIIYSYDETRKDGCNYSFIELPPGSIEKLTVLKKITKPANYETSLGEFHLTIKKHITHR